MPTTAEPEPAAEGDSPREILIESPLWERAPFAPGAAEAAVAEAAAAMARELDLGPEIGWAILLADDDALRQLNRDHRGKDAPTNVLSFPSFPPGALPTAGHIGDVAIAAETVIAEALDAGRPALHHLAHMAALGVGHLAGLDHVTDREAEEMEATEVRALARMGLPNPYRAEPESTDGAAHGTPGA
ncbi:MAG: rRNA maturation RNase YbeY [Alphaproteobacteria bacterium]